MNAVFSDGEYNSCHWVIVRNDSKASKPQQIYHKPDLRRMLQAVLFAGHQISNTKFTIAFGQRADKMFNYLLMKS